MKHEKIAPIAQHPQSQIGRKYRCLDCGETSPWLKDEEELQKWQNGEIIVKDCRICKISPNLRGLGIRNHNVKSASPTKYFSEGRDEILCAFFECTKCGQKSPQEVTLEKAIERWDEQND